MMHRGGTGSPTSTDLNNVQRQQQSSSSSGGGGGGRNAISMATSLQQPPSQSQLHQAPLHSHYPPPTLQLGSGSQHHHMNTSSSHHYSTSSSPASAATPEPNACSSSSVAELQRLSDSMAASGGDLRSQQHDHYQHYQRRQCQHHRLSHPHSPLENEDSSRLHHHHSLHSHHPHQQQQQQHHPSPADVNCKSPGENNNGKHKSPRLKGESGDEFGGQGYGRGGGGGNNAEAVDFQPPPPQPPVGNTQYLSENCVVFSYYGDDLSVSQIVDDHFARALHKQDSSNNETSSPEKSKGCVPMSQRNFPASFWISDYQNASNPLANSSSSATSSLSSLAMNHAALTAAAAVNASHHDIYGSAHDPYNFLTYGTGGGTSAAHGSDPWQNYMAAAGSPYSHHRAAAASSMQDVYSVSRLNPQQYSSFLQLQSTAMRQAAQQGRSAIDGYGASSTHSHYMTGLEGSMQGSSKELSSYWGF